MSVTGFSSRTKRDRNADLHELRLPAKCGERKPTLKGGPHKVSKDEQSGNGVGSSGDENQGKCRAPAERKTKQASDLQEVLFDYFESSREKVLVVSGG
jgi:hypothetical protein